MKALVFDVETTGLPKQRNASLFDTELWPYIVQMSWVVIDIVDCEIISINDHIVSLPEDVVIPEDSTPITDLSNEMLCATIICDVLISS